MGELLKGAPVAQAIRSEMESMLGDEDVARMAGLAVIRIGERPDDLAYERSLEKAASASGVRFVPIRLSEDAQECRVLEAVRSVNLDDSVSGCMIFRPMPSHIDERAVCNALDPSKDVDGIGADSLAGVFMNVASGFAPATASACIDMLDHYGIGVSGKKVVVVGRSLVIGKPVGMLMLARDATVAYCHSRSGDVRAEMRSADIVVCATGRPKAYGADSFSEGQVVLDVGMSVDADGHLRGDVDTDAVKDRVALVTPVPGGIGGVTTARLMMNVVEAASAKAAAAAARAFKAPATEPTAAKAAWDA